MLLCFGKRNLVFSFTLIGGWFVQSLSISTKTYELGNVKINLLFLDKEEEKKKLELREIAKKELEDWYHNHEEAIAKTKAANR